MVTDIKRRERTVIPPYVPYRTFRNFSDGLRQAIPPVIDRSVMNTMGGALQTQLLSALRYLGLIDDKNNTQETFRRFIKAEGADRRKALRGVLEESYRFLFEPGAGGFDLATGTTRQFTAKFQEAGAGGDTIRKCELFFLRAAEEAGIAISPHIRVPKDRGDQGRPALPRTNQRQTRTKGAVESNVNSRPTAAPNEYPPSTYDLLVIDRLVSKFPEFDPAWPDDVKGRWLENFRDLMRIVREAAVTENGAGPNH